MLHAGTAPRRRRPRWSPPAAGCCPSSATGADLAAARAAAYAAVERIRIRGAHHRTDIAAAVAEAAVLS